MYHLLKGVPWLGSAMVGSSADLHGGPSWCTFSSLDRVAYQSVGVIYGDIGTSPLYVFSSTFPNGPPSLVDLVGALSLIIWAITLVVTVKYVGIVLNADDEGEGGSFAVYSLLTKYVGGLGSRFSLDEIC